MGAWVHADAVAAEAVASVLAAHPEPTEPAVARDVVRALPDGSTLVVSSSMPIRDVEWFAAPRTGYASWPTAVPTGSTAWCRPRWAWRWRRRDRVAATALLIGDVAFLYDSNGLLGAARREVDLTVVVVDNDGGGIFSFLPQASALPTERFETLYGTPHGVDLAGW